MGAEKEIGIETAVTMKPPEMTFSDCGTRTWIVTLGASWAIFCTFGYVNAFGFAFVTFYSRGTASRVYQDPSTERLSRIRNGLNWICSDIFPLRGRCCRWSLFDRHDAQASQPFARRMMSKVTDRGIIDG